MLIVCLVIAIFVGFILGVFSEEDDQSASPPQQPESQNDIQFDPWTDEWYGQGPWWKKW